MKRSKLFMVFSLLMIAVFVLAACAPTEETPAAETEAPPSEETEAAEGLTFGVSLDALFLGRQAEMEGVRAAAEEQGVTLIESVADNDAQQQNAQIESFINQGVDAILIVPVDNTAILTAIDAAEEAGIPVVTFDRKVDGADYVSYHSGLDSYSDGMACGEYVKSQNDGGDNVVLHLLGALNDDNAIQRRDGFEAALEGEENLEIVQQPTDWNADTALAAVENALVNYPNLWAIQVPSDFMQDSIKTALEGAGKLKRADEPGHIIVCTIDGAEPGYRATVEGWTDAVVALPLGQLGRGALENAVKVVNGETLEVTDQRFPGTLYTWENALENADKIWGASGVNVEPMEETSLTFGVSLDALFLGRQAEMQGVREKAEELGVTLIESVADNDAQQQNAQIESFINQGVDAILIVPVDNTAILTAIDAAEEAGIPVVTFDRKVDGADYVSYHSGLDSYSDGMACGEYVKSQNDGGDNVVLHLLGALNDDNAIQRRDGFEAALEGEENLEIVQQPTDWNADTALAAVENALVNYPNLWAIQVPSDFMQDSIKTALEGADKLFKAGEEGHIIVCTIDGAEPGYRATVEGWTDAVVALPLAELGRGAVENAVKVVNGETLDVADQRFPGTLYTWENAEENSDLIWGANFE